jgi:signal transduction histidine kinase
MKPLSGVVPTAPPDIKQKTLCASIEFMPCLVVPALREFQVRAPAITLDKDRHIALSESLRSLHDAVENIAIGHVILLNDMNEHRRAAERAQQSERGMSRFLATMSHEIRTPRHSVPGVTELLRTANKQTADRNLDLIENAG